MCFFFFAALLARVDYQPPSVSRRSGASPAIVMTICEKKERKTAGNAGEAVRAEFQNSVESERTQHISQEIINRSPVHSVGKTKKEWMCSPGLYKVFTDQIFFACFLDLAVF